MASPRALTVAPGEPGFYHCICRCVRRAWLCGDDPLTGLNFDHRRGWIERKALELADLYAVSVYAYAVMSNHVHLVVHVDPARAATWSDEEVAERWSRVNTRLVPRRPLDAESQRVAKRDALLADPDRMAEVRRRLANLSWFMRYLNETIARAANREDGCTGRFWEGRFGCKALRDDTAVLGCMTYVDLNPIRADAATTLTDSYYTSARARYRAVAEVPERADEPLLPVAGPSVAAFPSLRLGEYLDLVEASGYTCRANVLRQPFESRIERITAIGCGADHWERLSRQMERWFGSAVGARDALVQFAGQTGRQWVKGVASSW